MMHRLFRSHFLKLFAVPAFGYVCYDNWDLSNTENYHFNFNISQKSIYKMNLPNISYFSNIIYAPCVNNSFADTDIASERFQSDVYMKKIAITNYENKIRLYSNPYKVFRYFASYQDVNNPDKIYMTLNDFLCSIMLNRLREKDYKLDIYQKTDVNNYQSHLPKDSVYRKVSKNGLLSYVDYLFLLTILSTSESHIEVVFRTIDRNGDGVVSEEEFLNAFYLFFEKSSCGETQGAQELKRFKKNMESLSIVKTFFKNGSDKDQAFVTIETFTQFVKNIKQELARLEFNHFKPIDGKISEVEFALLLISSSKNMCQKHRDIIQRVQNKYIKESRQKGVSFEDYLNFCKFLDHIGSLHVALDYCRGKGDVMDRKLLKHITKAVANVTISDHVIDLVFTIFDENGDDFLSYTEFFEVIKDRSERGLKRRKSFNFIKSLNNYKDILIDIF